MTDNKSLSAELEAKSVRWREFPANSFDRLCASANCSPAERDALAWHLAMFRCRQTYEALK